MFRRFMLATAALVAFFLALPTDAAIRTWVGGNNDWNGSGLNWTGLDEPDPDDDAVFDMDDQVDMTIDNEVLSLTLSGDVSLDTTVQFLDVNGDITLSGSGTRLRAGQNNLGGLPATSVSAYNITVGADATYQNANFTSFIHPTSIGVFNVESGGTLYGNGTIRNGDGIASATSVFINDSVIRPGNVLDIVIIGAAPPAQTLTLAAIDGEARIDLDGLFGGGAVDLQRNQTLDIDIQLNDDFDGVIDMAHNATLDIESAWTFAGTLNVDNGFVAGTFPIPSIPANVAYLQGEQITMNELSTSINIIDPDGTLQIDAPLVADEGTIDNMGLIVFNNTTTINNGVDFQMNGVDASFTVGAGVTVDINDDDMDFDGSGASTNFITVEEDGQLKLNLDSFEGNDRFDGVLELNSGSLSLSVTDASWTMDRRLHFNRTGATDPVLTGSAIEIGADTGTNDAQVTVTGNGSSRISPSVTWNSDTDLEVQAGATLAVLGFSTFNSVNGAENANYIGPGDIFFSGGLVNEETTLDFSGGTVGLDGGGAVVILLSAPDFTLDAPLTINAAAIDEYGRSVVFPSAQTSELTINSIVGGRLNVNLDDPNDSWTVNDIGVMHANGSNIVFTTFLSGNDLNMNGTLNVDGFTRSETRLVIGSTGLVDFVDASANLRFNGSDLSIPNRLEGGQITGPGEISTTDGRALHGYGTISVAIDFDGSSSELLADDGTLTISPAATLVDVGVLGTADSDGVLDVLLNWDTIVAAQVRLNGGEISGGTIFNNGADGIRGRGLLSAAVRNNTLVAAQGGGTLAVANPLNTNDWDGPANTGALRAFAGSTLELHDNAAFTYHGALSAVGGTVSTQGFAFALSPASSLTLETGTFASTHATNIGGTVNVNAGNPSTLDISNAHFESTSSVTLTGDLRLEGNTQVEQGATFAGGGALINTAGQTLTLQDGADVDVLVENNGTLALGSSPGQTTGQDYQQNSSGTWDLEIGGLGLSDFDRMSLTGAATLDGTLDLSLIMGFVPTLGDALNVLSATGGVLGEFANVSQPAAMPSDIRFQVNYLGSIVQLEVVESPAFTADFDMDGDVDDDDLSQWQGDFGLNGNSDADGDGDSDGTDFLAWQQQNGSGVSTLSTSRAIPEPPALLSSLVALFTTVAAHRRESRNSTLTS